MSGQVLPVTGISFRNRCVKLLVLNLLLLDLCLIFEISLAYVCLYRYYFSRCSSELTKLVSFPYCSSRSTCYCNRLHDFLVTIFDVIRMSMSNVSFLVQLDSGILCL